MKINIQNAMSRQLKKYVMDQVERAYDAAQEIDLDVSATIRVDDAVRQTLTLEITGLLGLHPEHRDAQEEQ